jgi:two-component system, NtrC family, sensor kinase
VIKRYGEIPPVACSPSQINQVLLNVMTNAAQAIEHEQGKLLLKTEAEGAWVRVSIQDNGKGISAENLSKIFDPFFTTKPVGQGTGLGLSISYQIIQAHGGTIQVASVPGKGTKFVISLPTTAGAVQSSAAAAGTAKAA